MTMKGHSHNGSSISQVRRHERLAQLFGELHVLPQDSRAARLSELADTEGDLVDELKSLLHHGEQPTPWTTSAILESGAHETISHPSRIGRYEVIRPLGEGGMGVVYLARQEHPSRFVALKVLHSRAHSRSMLRRFQREAELLGRLAHAHIACIFDAGMGEAVDEQGTRTVPYFAMEYVEGQPLDVHVRESSLRVPDRLSLFATICDAVHHAHVNGIVHRDLKPANILVSEAGGCHEPKILDFGIARSVGGEAQTMTLAVDTPRLVGTLPYMSPEQLAADAKSIDARSDVYSLGVILYELLTGRLPFDLSGAGLAEAARIIRDEEPRSLRSCVPSLSMELDTIVRTAMSKDAGQRYQSASELAADVRRFLRNEPISARSASRFYALRKFAQRNRGLVAGVVGAFVVLTSVTAYAVRQTQIARSQRDAANRLLEYAREPVDYLLAGAGVRLSIVMGAADIHRDLLEEVYVFYKRLADERPDDLENQRNVWRVLARLSAASARVGNTERAELLANQAHGIMERLVELDPDNPKVLYDYVQSLDVMRRQALRAGDPQLAASRLDQSYEVALDLVTRFPDEPLYHGLLADRHLLLAGALSRTSLQEEAEHLHEALAIYDQLVETDPLVTTRYLEDISEYAPMASPRPAHMGRLPMYQRHIASILLRLAQSAEKLGNAEEAGSHLQRALVVAEELVQSDETKAGNIQSRAAVLRRLAEYVSGRDPVLAREYALGAVRDYEKLFKSDAENISYAASLEQAKRLVDQLVGND